VRELLEVHHQLGRLDGAAALAVDGELVGTWAGGEARPGVPVSPDTRFPIGSITKSVVAVAVLQLAALGELELHAPIGRYLPAGSVAWGAQVTPHHCLAHTSGIPSLLRSHRGAPAVPLERLAAPIASDALLALLGGLALRFEPGARFEYSNSGYILLALAIERIAGRPLHEHLARAVLAPAGAAMAALVPDELEVVPAVDGAPAPRIHGSWLLGAGDLVASAPELARWLARVEEVLPEAWRARWLERHTPRYGYGVRIGARGGREVAWHEGMLPGIGATAHRVIAPRAGVVAVIATHHRAGGGHARTFLDRVADQLVALGCGEPPPDPPRPRRAFTARELA
jgi:D-alanyl-D-alanine carboxypeptidase